MHTYTKTIQRTLSKVLLLVLAFSLFSACQDNEALPIYGKTKIEGTDTIFHKIPDFKFMNQDSQMVSNENLSNNIYISDFFFMSCPSICPKVKRQMLKIYDQFEDEELVKLVSHTIDPKRDTPEKLKMYANNLEVNTDKWWFLTAEKGEIMDIADEYFVVALEDPDAPGGFDHSGKIILVDKDRHVRAFAEGTDPEDVDNFLLDIQKLVNEYKK